MEIKITTDLATISQIDFNFAELKTDIANALVKYNGIVYTDDSIKDAKGDRAKLRAFKEAIDTKRKEVKKQCLAPYEEFNTKIDELYKLIDSPILAIDGQVKAYEDKQKESKIRAIEAYYADNIDYLKELLPLAKIYNQKWENAGYKLKDIYNEIVEAITKTSSDLTAIEGLKSEFELQVKDKYLATLDLSVALAEGTRLEGQKARMAEYQQKTQPTAPQTQETPTPQPQETTEPVLTIDFRVWATQSQLNGLKAYLNANNIKFGKVGN